MAPQATGDTVKVRGDEYRLTAVKSTSDLGPKFYGRYRFTMVKASDATQWSAYGKRVTGTSRLTPVELPKPVEPEKCDHLTGKPGCELPACCGIPSPAVPVTSGRTVVPAEPVPAETGVVTMGRELAMATRRALPALDVTMPTYADTGDLDRPNVRRVQAWEWHAGTHTVRLLAYLSRSALTTFTTYGALYVDGFLVSGELDITRQADTLAGRVGYAVARHVDMLTAPTDVEPGAVNVIPAGASMRAARLADVEPGDTVRSFWAFSGHATVTGRPVSAQYGRVDVPATRDGRPETLRGNADDTVIIIDAGSVEPEPEPVAAMPEASGESEPVADTAPDTEPEPEPAVSAQPEPAQPADRAPVGRAAFSVDRDALADAMAYLVKVAPARPSVPVLSGVKIVADGDTVTLSTFDYERAATVTLDATVTVAGSTLVSCKALADMVGKLAKRSGAVTLDSAGVQATVTCGPARLSLPTMPVEDFPPLPATGAPVGTVDVRAMSDALASVKVSAGTDQTLPMLCTVRVQAGADRLTLTTCDRYRAGMVDVPWSRTDSDAREALIPARTVADALKRFATVAGKPGGELTIRHTLSESHGRPAGYVDVHNLEWVSLTFGRYTLNVRTYDGADYPPVESLYPTTRAATGTVDAAALLATVGRVSLACDKGTPVRLTWSADTVTVAAGGVDDIAASETVPAEFDGADGFTMAFNPAYLADGVKATGAKRVAFAFVDSAKPGLISADGAALDAFRYLIMPIRIGEGKPVDAGTAAAVSDAPAPAPAASEPEVSETTPDATAPATAPDAAAIPEPPATDAPAPDADTVERVAHAAYLAYEAGDYATALDRIAEGEHMAPAHMVAGSLTWAQIRAAVEEKRGAAPDTVSQPEPEPEPVAAPVESVPDTAPATDTAPDRSGLDMVRDILSRATWSTGLHKVRGTREKIAVHVLTLPAGRLSRDDYLAVAAVVSELQGTWSKANGGFVFEAPKPVWNGGFTRSGEEKLAAWLAAHGPATADTDAPATVEAEPATAEAEPAAPVQAESEPEPVAPVAVPAGPVPAPAGPEPAAPAPVTSGRVTVGQYARIDGADGHGNPLTVEGYVTHVAPTLAAGDRVRVSATPDGPGRVVYVNAAATVTPLPAPVAAVQAEPVTAEPATPAPADVVYLGSMFARPAEPEPVAAEPEPATAEPVAPAVDLAAIERALASMPAAIVAAVQGAAPVVPATVTVPPSGALTFTLAAWTAEAGVSYRAARRAVREALNAAGIRATMETSEGNRRVFTVRADGADRDQVAAIVRGAATLES